MRIHKRRQVRLIARLRGLAGIRLMRVSYGWAKAVRSGVMRARKDSALATVKTFVPVTKRRVILGSFFLVLAVTLVARPERLPIRTYTTADGLAFDRVNRIVRDSRGFLWFCTDEGLSRFDGYGFKSYTTQAGLPHQHVNDLLETRSGVYWVATDGGLCRFDPVVALQPADRGGRSGGHRTSRPMFAVYELSGDEDSRHVNAVIEDRLGTLWCGTDAGLYRVLQNAGQFHSDYVDIGVPHKYPDDQRVHAFAEDQRGYLWIGSTSGLYRRALDGATRRYSTLDGLPADFVQALFVDREGRLWAGTRLHGLCLIATDAEAGERLVTRVYRTEDGLWSNRITAVFQSSDGRLWVGVTGGLCELVPSGGGSATGTTFVKYDSANGLSTTELTALAEDMGHNLWVGTRQGGAMRLARNGLTTFTAADGLDTTEISSVFEDRQGQLCVTTARNLKITAINRFDGKRFTGGPPNLMGRDFSGGLKQQVLLDREGEWWVPVSSGIFRFPNVSVERLKSVRPENFYTVPGAPPGRAVLAVYEDAAGDLWLSIDSAATPVARWERASGKIRTYRQSDGLPAAGIARATSFREDGKGALWIGFNNSGGLVRYRNGQFRAFTGGDGFPITEVVALYTDHGGWLWIAGGADGLIRVGDPAADQPTFVRYTESNGLSSSIVWCVAEDYTNRIYIGTGRGIDVLDPGSDRFNRTISADGLTGSEVRVAFADHTGTLWFVTATGLSCLRPARGAPAGNTPIGRAGSGGMSQPEIDDLPTPPPVYITAVRAAGRAIEISELGESRVEGLTFAPSENRVQIDFAGLDFGAGPPLRYKYRLEGSDTDWSLPGEARTVSYSSLRPGRYRFDVLAVGSDGSASESSASVAFELAPPIWQRWWFETGAAVLIMMISYATYRYRLARFVELERVRTRIATDLHDDIGSSLSRMAILSEVVKRRPTAENSGDLLGEIAESGRRLVDAMSDIVWSIDPRRDDLGNLAARVREFAAGMLDNAQIKWTLEVPAEVDHLRLGPDERRQVFLILKEAITNVARHSECTSVRMSIAVSHNRLHAEVKDDGRGLPTESSSNGSGGQGLESMKRRAAHLGGSLSIASSSGNGTCLKFEVPVK